MGNFYLPMLVDDDARARIAARLLEPFAGRMWYEIPVNDPLYLETEWRMKTGEGMGWLSESILTICHEQARACETAARQKENTNE